MLLYSLVLYAQIKLVLNTGNDLRRSLCLFYLPQNIHDKIKERGCNVQNYAPPLADWLRISLKIYGIFIEKFLGNLGIYNLIIDIKPVVMCPGK